MPSAMERSNCSGTILGCEREGEREDGERREAESVTEMTKKERGLKIIRRTEGGNDDNNTDDPDNANNASTPKYAPTRNRRKARRMMLKKQRQSERQQQLR
jgi:hypothetical protein